MALNEFTNLIQTADADGVNENFQQSIVRASASSEDTTEYSQSANNAFPGTLFSYSKTFTPPTGADNIITVMKIEYDIKIDAGSQGFSLVGRLINDDTGNFVYLTNRTEESNDNIVLGANTTSTSFVSKTEYATTLSVHTTTSEPTSVAPPIGSMLGSSYTLQFYAVNSDGTNTQLVTIRNITVTAYWQFLQDAVVEGWA